MSRVSFNSIIIVVFLLTIVTIAVILPREYRKNIKKFHTAIQIVAIILAVALLVFMLLSLDYTGTPCMSGEIVEIRTLGSFAGIYDRYKIILIDSDGNTREIQSIFPIDGHSLDMKVGAYCELYGSTFIDSFFYSYFSEE